MNLGKNRIFLRTTLLLAMQLTLATTFLAAQTENPSADISGKWHFLNNTEGGDREMTATFKLDGDRVTGKYGAANVKGTYKGGELDLAFPYNSEEAGMTATLKMKARLKDGKLVGTWEWSEYSGTFTADKEK